MRDHAVLVLTVGGILGACAGTGGSTVNGQAVAEKLAQGHYDLVNKAREESAKFASTITLIEEDFEWGNLATLEVQETCRVAYTVGEEHGGVIPGSQNECLSDDKDAAMDGAKDWLENSLGTGGDDVDRELEWLDWSEDFIAETGPMLTRLGLMGYTANLGACAEPRVKRQANNAARRAELLCQRYESPGLLLDDYVEAIEAAVERVESRLDEDPGSRPTPILNASQTQGCRGAAPGGQVASIPGSVSGSFYGTPQAYKIHAFAGEILSLDLGSRNMDPVMDLYDANCSYVVTSDDDGGPGNASQIRYAVPEEGEYVVVARGYQGSSGSFTLTVGVQGRPAMTDEERSQLRKFSSWGESMIEASEEEGVDADLLAAWQNSQSSSMQVSCLNAQWLSSDVVARSGFGLTDALEQCAQEAYLAASYAQVDRLIGAGAEGEWAQVIRNLNNED